MIPTEDFEQVYRENYRDVYRFVLSLCRDSRQAEEITQEAFFRAYRSFGSFRGQCQLRVWLCQIAKNTFYTQSVRQKRTTELAEAEEETGPGPEEECLDADAVRHLHRVLHGLEEPYKEVFSLHTFAELPFAEIAELFGKTESWARVTYYRAKTKIKETIDHENEL